ncbi:hypothetical protein KY312_00305, partial [Candidatus Woesearchaeota archaeon]|nr:hypothetical protein [Candidatus Woesearchaeota archaeon]
DGNTRELSELIQKYPEINEEGLTRHEEYKKFFSQFSPKDKKRHEELFEQNHELNEEHSNFYFKEQNRKWRICRKLYGILGIVQGEGKRHRYYYKFFMIPNENYEPVHDAVKTGIFAKELEIEDLFLLEFLLERTKEIKNGKTTGHNPRFSIPRIIKEYGGEKRDMIRERLDRLTGILCHTYGPEGSPYKVGSKSEYVYWQNWFIPFRRFDLAEKTIKSR